jgi:hypothetical protein
MRASREKLTHRAIAVALLGCVVWAAVALAGTDVKVNQDVGPLLQNECSITINLGMANNLVVGYNEAPGSGNGLGISYSFTNGASWLDSQTQSVWGTEADPAVASDLLGNVFAAMISYANTGPLIFPNNGIYVSRSTDGGITWPNLTMVDQQLAGAVPAYFTDKEYICVDTYPASPYANRVYVTWQRDNANTTNADIYFAWSSDQAATFNYATGTPAGRISDLASTPGTFPPVQSSLGNAPVPAVSPIGDVYVAWQDAPLGVQTPGRIYVDMSNDGGTTWGADVIAANYNTLARYPKGGTSFQVRSFPSIAVSPVVNPSGFYDVYVVYADDPDRVNDVNIESVLPPGTSSSQSQQIACDGGSHVYAVWADWRAGGTYGDVYFNRSTDYGATWGTDQRLNTGVTAGSVFINTPRIAADGANVYVVWEDRRNSATTPDIYYNYSVDNGANWQASAIRLDLGTAAGTTSAWSPDLAASSGNVCVVWADDRSGDADILCNYSTNGGVTWQAAATRVDAAGAGVWSNMPQISAQGANMYVTWWDARNGPDDIFVNVSSNSGANWQPSDVQLDGGSAISGHPKICSTGSYVYVAYWDQRNGLQDVYFNYSSNNGLNWQLSDIRVDVGDLPPGSAQADMVQIACAGTYVHIVWADTRNGMSDIYHNYSPNNGATWQAADTRLDSDWGAGLHSSYEPRVTAQPGFVWVAWEDDRHGWPDIYYRYSLNNGVTWYGRDFRLDSGDYAGLNGSHMPEITSAPGHVYAVWEDTRNGLGDIYFNSSSNNGISWRDGPDDGDIMLVSSYDGGATWNAPSRVNDDPGTEGQFQPWIDVKPNGTIDVVWLDRRNDPLNDSFLETYMGTSTDRGLTFVNNVVSDVIFGPPPPPTVWPWPWMGEYIGIDVDATHGYVVWTDTRNSDRDIYFDRFENPSGGTGVHGRSPVPEKAYLAQNVPNPFNPTTVISFGLAAGGSVSLRVYDVSGGLVRVLVDGRRPAGHHEAHWDSRDETGAVVASGVYFYRLKAGDYSETRKMVLLK